MVDVQLALNDLLRRGFEVKFSQSPTGATDVNLRKYNNGTRYQRKVTTGDFLNNATWLPKLMRVGREME